MDRNKRRVTYMTGANTTLGTYGESKKKKKKKRSGSLTILALLLALALVIAISVAYALRETGRTDIYGICTAVNGGFACFQVLRRRQ